MKKVLVISEFILPEQNSTGYFWYKIIQKMAQSAITDDISVIAPVNEQDVVKYFDKKVNLNLFSSPEYNKNSLASRVWGQVKQTYLFYKKIKGNLHAGTKIVSGTNPLFLMVLIAILKIFKPFQWHLLVHDVFPQNLVPAGLLKKHSIIYKILNTIFNLIYAQADHIIVIGRDMETILRQKKYEKAITVIPNWVDFKEIELLNKNNSELIKKLNWEKDIVFQFFGNIGRVQGIDHLIQAIQLVKHPQAKFLFIGGGSAVEVVQSYIENNQQTNNVAYINELPSSQRSLGLSSCDIAIVTLAEGMFGLGVPSKAYFSMAANRPILAIMDENAEVACMVKEHQIGWVESSNQPRQLARLIDDICERELASDVNSPRVILEKYYHQDVLLEKFIKALRLDND
ncbi:glycosyltransferase family 4 protein [Acinetobacter towneri]|uniref:glycosyltransferase family 4 protein n=1 Tax=Acinetobacter towneri TaxID=202956 RepID=UPI002574D26F|nr:glycosyltransferase family 4 protein [Acinetobacter towneri]MDM1283399.1 glycosyltransferase family 4 protein [Acinetobacter towneri]